MFSDTARDNSTIHDKSADAHLLQQRKISAQTIDVNGLLTTDVCSTGSFDLRCLESTSFGKLLDAIPLPVFVVDQWHHVVFANQSCDRSSDDGTIVGRSFEELVPTPNDAERAQELTQKAVTILENAFETRKPNTTEAILQFGKRRRWYRLHLRSVRLASQRHVLVALEDLTSERTHQRISRREKQGLRAQYNELKLKYAKLIEKSRSDENRLSREIRRRKRAEAKAQVEKERLLEIFRGTPVGLAIVGQDGVIVYANEPFREMFNEECGSFLSDRPQGSQSGSEADWGSAENRIALDVLTNDTNRVARTSFFAVPAEGGEPREVQVTAARLSSREHVIICDYR